ncbi:hypothetical protein ABZ929_16460 [Streptomyces physcomitrii]|uniref:hypothetical protein n=1 Tax=Streptomyces physcomitrii TaxID=2724184 RepID=UPI0033DFE87A
MEAELAGLASSAATAVVGLMLSEAWEQGRSRLARFLGRGGGEAAVAEVEEELRSSQRELVAARDSGDEEEAGDIQLAWRQRMRRALREDPEAAEELRRLLAELEAETGKGTGVTVTNTISGGVQHGPVIQGQSFHGSITFQGPDPR